MTEFIPQRRLSDDVRNNILLAYQQRRQTDKKLQDESLNKTIESQNQELLDMERKLFNARATALICFVTMGIVLYQWLMAPALEAL